MLALLLAALGTRGAVVVHFGAGMVTRGSCVPCGRRVRVPPSALCSTAAGGSSSASNLNREMLEIAAPALLGLAIDPVASLVDTAFVGHYCTPAELAGAGVSISVFNLLSRTFNFIGTSTTSRVASVSPETAPGEFTEAMASEAAGSLAVAVTVGVALTLAMTAGGGSLLRLLGVGRGSDLAQPARRYLAARALSAPAALSLMALQGAFRGARDTRTPLAALALASALNVALDPLMIVTLNGGVAGAALATTVSQYAAAALLWRRLARACDGISTASGQWMGLPRPPLSRCTNIFRAGSWLTVRTFVLSGTLSVASGAAAAAGVVAGAAHLVCFQLWMAVSLLADAIAVAAQAMLVPAPHPLPHTSRSPSHLTLTLTSHPHPQTSPSPSHLTLTLTSHPSLLTHHAHPHISPSPSHLTLHSSNITLTLTSHPHPHISPSLLTHHPHPHISPLPFTHYPHSSHIILTLTSHPHPHISPFTPQTSRSPSHLTLTLTSHPHSSHITLTLTSHPYPSHIILTPHTLSSPSHITLTLTSHPSLLTSHPHPHISPSPSHLTLTLTSHPYPHISPSPSHITLTLTSHSSLLTHHPHPSTPHTSPSPSLSWLRRRCSQLPSVAETAAPHGWLHRVRWPPACSLGPPRPRPSQPALASYRPSSRPMRPCSPPLRPFGRSLLALSPSTPLLSRSMGCSLAPPTFASVPSSSCWQRRRRWALCSGAHLLVRGRYTDSVACGAALVFSWGFAPSSAQPASFQAVGHGTHWHRMPQMCRADAQ